MSTWKFVVSAPGMGEKNVPAPKTAEILGISSGQVLIKRTGTWVHEEDWPYLESLRFPCRGVMKDGFMVGCPDARQMATRPPEPPYEPPPAFFETPPMLPVQDDDEALKEPTLKYKRRKKDYL